MRTYCLLFLAGALVCLGACQPATQPPPQPDAAAAGYKATSTIRDIMDAMVMPPADVLWGAASVSVSDKGIEANGPKNDEEWAKVRRQAITLVEASDLILTPGRHVASSGEKSKAPGTQLDPEQIDAMISKDPAAWAQLAHKLHDAAAVALKAIEAKNVQGLADAGDGLNTACEDCHKKYWYPNEGKPAAPAPESEKK